MISPKARHRAIARCLAALLLLAVLSCNLAPESGHTYIDVRKDTAWTKFDSLEIAWRDSVSGRHGILFQGDPGALAEVNKLPADGYEGGKIVVTLKGFRNHQLTYEEERDFDGANPGATTKKVLLAPATPGTPKTRPPKLTAIKADDPVSIGDSVAFAADASLDSGSLKGYAWDYDGDGKFDDSGSATGKSAHVTGGFRYHAKGTFKVTLKAVSESDSAATDSLDIHVISATESNLTDLVPSAGRLSPPFNPAVIAYADTVPYEDSSLTVTPTGNGALKVNGDSLASGKASAPLGLRTGANAVAITVQLPGAEPKTYSISVLRRDASSDARLKTFTLSGGSWDKAFTPGDTLYTVNVADSISSLTALATLMQPNATLAVDQKAETPGAPFSVDLHVGSNPLDVVVTAQNGDKKTYRIAILRAPNGNTGLSSLLASAGTPAAVAGNDSAYALSVDNGVTSITVTPTASAATSTLKVNGATVVSGNASSGITLPVGPTAVKVEVTAQNGASKTYLLTVTRAANSDATLSGLAVSAGALAPSPFAPGTLSYSLTVPNGVASTTVTATASASVSAVAVEGKTVPSGHASDSVSLGVGLTTIAVLVTAESGATKTYSIKITRLARFIGVAAGIHHVIALKDDGTLLAWGENAKGESSIPAGLKNVIAVTAGEYFTVALKGDGTVVAWGDTSRHKTAVPAGLQGVTAIAAGYGHTLALKGDGTVAAWGDDSLGECDVPAGLTGVKAIAAGFNHSVAVKADGSVVVWGDASYGKADVPPGLTGVAGVAAGYGHTAAARTDGTVVAWGTNSAGESTVPAGLGAVQAVYAGEAFTVAFKRDGTVAAWGFNGRGETTVPPGLKGVAAISAKGGYTIALKGDGTMVGWGDDTYGQTDIPAEAR